MDIANNYPIRFRDKRYFSGIVYYSCGILLQAISQVILIFHARLSERY